MSQVSGKTVEKNCKKYNVPNYWIRSCTGMYVNKTEEVIIEKIQTI